MVKSALGFLGLVAFMLLVALGSRALWHKEVQKSTEARGIAPVPAPIRQAVEPQEIPPPPIPGDAESAQARPPAPKKRTATSSPRTSRGVAFTSLVASYMAPEQLPKALGLVADTCDQQRTLMNDRRARYEADEKVDNKDELELARAIRDAQRDLVHALVALPGSTFDKKAGIALLQSETYLTNCTHAEGDDDE